MKDIWGILKSLDLRVWWFFVLFLGVFMEAPGASIVGSTFLILGAINEQKKEDR